MNNLRKKRLIVITCMLVALTAATLLILFALRSNINLFYTPSQLTQIKTTGQTIRLGGMVVKNSVNKSSDNSLAVSFKLSDGNAEVKVNYSGILPDLFREGQGIVALGSLQENGQFKATQVLAKHDENYMPPQLKQRLKKS